MDSLQPFISMSSVDTEHAMPTCCHYIDPHYIYNLTKLKQLFYFETKLIFEHCSIVFNIKFFCYVFQITTFDWHTGAIGLLAPMKSSDVILRLQHY